ncbi:hypothetical protein [Bacteroides sp.]|uniref:hypothetical protein n=1 Tax=Bacteroides sp. TaxID=29523 RepID=UPI0023C30594|nr:hypothetical protein [Bacteroides sp.]MDE6216897.1 hypothetical protein [Bacteroides sp.]
MPANPSKQTNVKIFFELFLQPARSGEKTAFPRFSAVLPACSLSAPYQDLFGFGRSSDKLHSLGPKNVRRTSEETPKKLRSGKGPDKTQTGRADADGTFREETSHVNNYDSTEVIKRDAKVMKSLRTPTFRTQNDADGTDESRRKLRVIRVICI